MSKVILYLNAPPHTKDASTKETYAIHIQTFSHLPIELFQKSFSNCKYLSKLFFVVWTFVSNMYQYVIITKKGEYLFDDSFQYTMILIS